MLEARHLEYNLCCSVSYLLSKEQLIKVQSNVQINITSFVLHKESRAFLSRYLRYKKLKSFVR